MKRLLRVYQIHIIGETLVFAALLIFSIHAYIINELAYKRKDGLP